MDFWNIFLIYTLAGLGIILILFIFWIVLDRFPNFKKIRDILEYLIDTISSQW